MAMKVLVVTSEPISAPQLRDALGTDTDPTDAEVMVVAPALSESALRFWISDVDEAIARADEVRRTSVAKLDEAGVAASGDTGEGDPQAAIEDALKTFGADRIVVFTHEARDQRYREDVDRDELAERFGLPVDHAIV
jgi:hypothetical protein